MKQQRILHVLNTTSFSGAEQVASNIVKASNEKDDLQAIYVTKKGDVTHRLDLKGIPYLTVKSMIFELPKVVSKWKPTIIHTHDYRITMLATLLFPFKKIVAHIHQDPEWAKRFNLRTILFLLSALFVTKIIYISQAAQDDFRFSQLSFIKKKSYVITNSICVEQIEQLIPINNRQFDVCYVGRFEAVKNPLQFVEIIRAVAQLLPTISVVMVGDGSQLGEVKQYLDDHQLADTIQLVGYQDDVQPYLRESKLIVIPSINEGFSLVALEASVNGVVPIASDAGGLTEVMDQLGGYRATSVHSFCDIISRLLVSNDELSKKSQHVKQMGEQKFSFETYIKYIFRVYEEC